MAAETQPEGTRPRFRLRGILLVLSVIALAVALLLCGLPTLVSTPVLRDALLHRVSRRTGTEIAVASWRLRWRSGLAVNGLDYRDRAAGIHVAIDRMTTDRGLWALLVRGEDGMGEIHVVRPRLETQPPVKPSSAAGAPPVVPALEPPGGDGAPVGPPAYALPLARLKGEMILREGTVIYGMDPTVPPVGLEGIEARVVMARVDGPVAVKASGRLAGSRGEWSLAGTVMPPAQLPVRWQEMGLQVTGRCHSVDLAAVDHWLASSNAPSLAGVGEGQVVLSMVGDTGVDLSGHLGVSGLRCSGGMLGEDRLRLESVTADFGLQHAGGRLTVERVLVNSALMRGQFKGTVDFAGDKAPVLDLSSTLWLDLAVAASQLPHALAIREGLEVSRGELSLKGRLARGRRETQFDLELQTRDLAARQDNKPIEMDQPIHVKAAGSLGDRGVALSAFEMAASFATARGSGSLEDLKISVEADLTKASAELGKFLELPTRLRGTLSGALGSRAADPLSRKLDGVFSIQGCEVHPAVGQPWALGDVRFALATALRVDGEGVVTGGSAVSLSVTSTVATARATVGRFTLGKEGRLQSVQETTLAAAGELGRLLPLLRDAGFLTNAPPVRGQVDLAASGGWSAGVTTLESNLHIRQLLVGTNAPAGTAEDVTVALSGALSSSRIDLAQCRIESRPLSLTCRGGVAGDRAQRRLALEGDLAIDYARVTALARALDKELPWAAVGHAPGPFALQMPWVVGAAPVPLAAVRASVPLRIESLTAFGMQCGAVTSEVRLADGVLVTDIATDLNKGRLVLSPRVDLRQQPALLSMETPAHVLRDVRLTTAMASSLLARIHPVFHDCAVMGGRTDLHLDELRVPLGGGRDASRDAVVTGSLSLTNVVMRPSGLFSNALAVAKLASREAQIAYQVVPFRCEDGRVRPEPLEVRADKALVTLSGSVGLDGTLNYLADLPLTADMVDERVWKYLKNTRIQLVIDGTVTDPHISSDSWRSAYDRLVKEALKNLWKEEGAKLLEKLF